MRAIVCGGRDYNGDAEWNNVMATLSAFHARGPLTAVIQGGAAGADLLARAWADMQGVKSITVPANWAEFGRAAGPMRNERMLKDFTPDIVIAFPGGKGTADMVRRAREASVMVAEVSKSGKVVTA